MNDGLQPRAHGVPDPKGVTWLKEVRIDAARNAIEHLRNQKEKQEFEAAKARGITPEEIIAKGKQDLGVSQEDAPDDKKDKKESK